MFGSLQQVIEGSRTSINDVTTTGIGQIAFATQPPANLRKSNFFNFTLSIFDTVGHQVEVEDAVFVRFIEEVAENEASKVKKQNNTFKFSIKSK